jgi:hypothetical protein
MKRLAACLSALVGTLFVTALAGAAIRHHPDNFLLPANPALTTQSMQSEQAYDQMLFEQGVEPRSSKAQIVHMSDEKIRQDPGISATLPGGA